MASPFAPTPPQNRPAPPNPFGAGVMPPQLRPSGRGQGMGVARQTIAAAPPVPSRDTPLTEEISPLPYDPKGHRVDYSDTGPSFFGSGILSNIGQGLGYNLLPEEAPGPLSYLPDAVYGVVQDYSTVLDLGLTAAAAVAAPWTGGTSFIGQAALRGGIRGGLAKGAKFALAPAVHGGFGRRLAVEAGIGLGATAGGKGGAHLGREMGGTPGAIVGGLAGGLLGGGVTLGAIRPLVGRPRSLYKPQGTSGNQYTHAYSEYEIAMAGGRANDPRAQAKEENIVGRFYGHSTDGQLKDYSDLDLEDLKNGQFEQEPDHGPLSSAFRVGGFLRNLAVGINGDYNPNTRMGKMVGILQGQKIREDQAPRLANHTITPFVSAWENHFLDVDGNILKLPSIREELESLPRAEIYSTRYDQSLMGSDLDLAAIGGGYTATPEIQALNQRISDTETLILKFFDAEQNLESGWSLEQIRELNAISGAPSDVADLLEDLGMGVSGRLGLSTKLADMRETADVARAGNVETVTALEKTALDEAVARGEALLDAQVRAFGGGPAALDKAVDESQAYSQVFEDAFNWKHGIDKAPHRGPASRVEARRLEAEDAAVREVTGSLYGGTQAARTPVIPAPAVDPSIVQFGEGLYLRELPDGRFMNPEKGYIFTKGQADGIAQMHKIIEDAGVWLDGVAGPDFKKAVMEIEAGARWTPRTVLRRLMDDVRQVQNGDNTGPNKPLGLPESWDHARWYKGQEINEALHQKVVYDNDMPNVLLTFINSTLRAGRNEQLRVDMATGGFSDATQTGITQAKWLVRTLRRLDKQSGTSRNAATQQGAKVGKDDYAILETGGPVELRLTAKQLENLSGLGGSPEGKEIADELIELYESARRLQDAQRSVYVQGSRGPKSALAAGARIGDPSTKPIEGWPVRTRNVYRSSKRPGDTAGGGPAQESSRDRRARERHQVNHGGPAIEGQEITVYRGTGPGGIGSVARGGVDQADLQLGPAQYVAGPGPEARVEAATYGEVEELILDTTNGVLDLDAPISWRGDWTDEPIVRDFFMMGEIEPDDVDSVGEVYFLLQRKYRADGQRNSATPNTHYMGSKVLGSDESPTLPTGVTASGLRKDNQLRLDLRKKGYAKPVALNPRNILRNADVAADAKLNEDLKRSGYRVIKSNDPMPNEWAVIDERAIRKADPNYEPPVPKSVSDPEQWGTERGVFPVDAADTGLGYRVAMGYDETRPKYVIPDATDTERPQRLVAGGKEAVRGSVAGRAGSPELTERIYHQSGNTGGSDPLKEVGVREALMEAASNLEDRLLNWNGTLRSVKDPIFEGQFFDQRTAGALRKFTGAEPSLVAAGLKPAADFADATRTMQASGDLSGAFIQGLILLAVDPVAWGAGWYGSIRALADPHALNNFIAKKRSEGVPLDDWQLLQLAAPEEMFRAASERGILSRSLRAADRIAHVDGRTYAPGEMILTGVPIPGTGKRLPVGLTNFERAFTYYGTYARINLMEAYAPLARNQRELGQAQNIINNMTGQVSPGSQIIGPKQEHFERTFMFFAPRYTRAALAAVAAVVNPRSGIEGTIARDALAKLAVGGTITYIMLAESMGQEPKMDPTRSDFMTVELNGDRIGIGTVWTSMTRLIASLVTDPAFQGKLNNSPLLFTNAEPGEHGIDERISDNPLVRWVRGRTSVLTGNAWEIATGSDFIGAPIEGPIDITKHLASNALPFAVESAILGEPKSHTGIFSPVVNALGGDLTGFEGVDLKNPATLLPTGYVSEFAGLRNAPMSYAKQRNALRKKQAYILYDGAEWGELNKLQQDRVDASSPEITQLIEEGRKWRTHRGQDIDNQITGWYEEVERIDEIYNDRLDFGLSAVRNGAIDLREFRQSHLSSASAYRRDAYETLDRNPDYADVQEWFDWISNNRPNTNPEKPEDLAYTKYLQDILLNPEYMKPEGFDYRERRIAEENFKVDYGLDTYNYVLQRLDEGKDLDPLVRELVGGQEKYSYYWGSADEPGSIAWQVIQSRNNVEIETRLFIQWEESIDEDKFELEAGSSVLRSILRKRSQVRSKVRQLDPMLDIFLFRWGYTSSLNAPQNNYSDARRLAKTPYAMEPYMLRGSGAEQFSPIAS